MSFVTTYLPGRTAIHRLPAGLKLALLAATGVALAILDQWWEPVALLGVVLACYPLAGMPVRAVSAQLRSMGWVLLAVGVFQLIVSGWRSMVDVLVTVVVMVLAAGLISLTTSMEALTEFLLRILRPLPAPSSSTSRGPTVSTIAQACASISASSARVW